MLHDLAGRHSVEASADFIVIGAGTVGLPTSVKLAAAGRKVLCLESGGERQDEDTHPLNEVVHAASPYEGASAGRFRGLGGTSSRWGGALIPFQAADIENAGWPVSIATLEPYIAEIEALFGLEPGPYFDPAFPFGLGRDHVNRLAKWPAFKKRNVAGLLDRPIREDRNLDVWLNAHVTDIRIAEDGVSILATSAAGDTLRASARRLIIAAGAIETTRLALLIDRLHDGAVSRASPSLGRYFTDHISTEVAEIVPTQKAQLNKIVGFRFGPGGGMRNIRFELAPDSPARDTLPPSFSHVGFEVDKPGGFDALRELFRYVQMRRPPPARTVLDLAANAPWLARAVWWRFIQKRLLFPLGARLVVHAVVEQVPTADSRITLSERRDAFDTPLAEITWRISEEDVANLAATAELFGRTWRDSDLSKLGEWRGFDHARIAKNLEASGGIFHPTGSTRMGADAATGVVDKDLRLFAFPSVQLISTSVLPTGGGANPTMMALLLAMRCVDQHRKAG